MCFCAKVARRIGAHTAIDKNHTDPPRARAYVQVYIEAQPQITACCTVRRRFRIT